MIRVILMLSIVVSCLGMISPVRADTRITVHDFYGPHADRMRADVVNLLELQSGVTIVSQGQIASAAKKLQVDPYSPEGRQALSRELQLSAWMTGMVQRRAGNLKLTVVVYDGVKHLRISRAQLTGRSVRNLSAAIKRRLWRKSGRAILRAGEPEVVAVAAKSVEADASAQNPTPVMISESSTRDEPRALDDGATVRRPGEAMRVFVGVGSPYRTLAYSDPVTTSLGDYQLSGTPMLDLQLSFHPARFATAAWPSWLGLDARAQIALSTPTVDRNGNQFKSRYDAFHVGLRARIPVARHYVSVFSGYAQSRFDISSTQGAVRTPTPSVDYRMIRSGLGAEFTLSEAWQLGLDGSWLSFLSVGEIGRWFPRASAGGLELSLFATYRMTNAIFGRMSASYQRAFFDFNPRPGDQNVAGGATDQYLALSVGAGINL